MKIVKSKFRFLKTANVFLTSLLCVLYFSSCNKDDSDKSDEKTMSNVRILLTAPAQTLTTALQPDGKTFLFTFPATENLQRVGNAGIAFDLSDGASATPTSGSTHNFNDNPKATFIVRAENGSTAEYIVEMQIEASSEAEITAFDFTIGTGAAQLSYPGTINAQQGTIAVTVAYVGWSSAETGAAVLTLSNWATATPASPITVPLPPYDAQNPPAPITVDIEVEAGDGTKKDWKATLTLIMPSSQASITGFNLDFYEGQQPENTPATFTRGQIRMSSTTSVTDNAAIIIDNENRTITYSLPALPAWFNKNKMTVYPTFISFSDGWSNVEPHFNTALDFSQDQTYVITAEDGVTKETWMVKAPTVGSYYFKEIWAMSFPFGTDEWRSGEAPNSIGIIGDYLNISRTELLINKSTGALTTNELDLSFLNPTDVPGWGSQTSPFFVTNDDHGNFIGTSLINAAWSQDYFNLFVWKNGYDSPAEMLAAIPLKDADGEPLEIGFGRKVQVLGDINGNGLIISVNSFGGASGQLLDDNRESGMHYIWKIENGVVDIANPIIRETNITLNTNAYQLLTPININSPEGPYYIGTAQFGSSGPFPNLVFSQDGAGPGTQIRGPFDLLMGDKSRNGWGNQAYHYHKLFNIDNKNMIAVFTGSNSEGHICFTVMERESNTELTTIAKTALPWNNAQWINTNITGSFTMEVVGGKMRFYVFPTNRGIFCYELAQWE